MLNCKLQNYCLFSMLIFITVLSCTGYIGKLKLQIPVSFIKSQPWVVQIDQLYIVAGPTQPGAYNEEEEAARKETVKQALLAKLEEEWKTEQQTNKGSWWFLSPLSVSLPSNVIANLQVCC